MSGADTTSSSASSARVIAIHAAVAGRLRVSVGGLRRSETLKSRLERCLPGTNGIHRLSADIWTGNALIFYEPAEDVTQVLSALEASLNRDAPEPELASPPALGMEAGSERGFLSLLASSARSLMALGRGSGRPAEADLSATLVPAAVPQLQPWHAMGAREVAHFWGTPVESGLDSAEAVRRLAECGVNALPAYKGRSPWSIFRDQFKSLPVLLLLGSAALSIATGGVGDAAVIVLVVLMNASMGFATEAQAERTIATLLDYGEPLATVRRGGAIIEIRAKEVVPGDILILARGMQTPADARVLEASRLSVDESALTGESMPVEKSPAAIPAEAAVLSDRTNMVYRGSVVTGGSGLAIAVATGRFTEIGAVQRLIAEAARPRTPIERQLAVLSNRLVWASIAVAGGALAVGMLRGFSFLQMVKSAISLAVAAVPEGLPVVATTALASTVDSMLRHNVLVRRLDATEALGLAQVVCLDKTGTLTQNRMKASWAYAGTERFLASGEGRLHPANSGRPGGGPDLRRLLEVCSLCSEAELRTDRGKTHVVGSPTEAALVETALSEGIDVAALRREHPLLQAEHRAENHNYMATWHEDGESGVLLAVKGSPVEVLRLCRYYARNGQVIRMTGRQRGAIEAENAAMAESALRVLACAFREAQRGQDVEPGELTWLGLIGMSDPPREGVAAFIQELRAAGIRPTMITGDQTPTALAVGRALGFDGSGAVIDSQAMEGLEVEELVRRISGTEIFSRVNPSDKLRVVRALQSAGAVVAMTGDGINDGPALKAADIGITLGRSGTQVAREVADVVLLDDNIHSLLPAIRDGRRIHDNIRTAIHYISATNACEVALVFLSLAAGMGQALNPRQLLWINVLSDVFPELAMAMQAAEADVMRLPPRDARAPVIGSRDLPKLARQSCIITAAVFGCYAYAFARYGAGPRASTVGFLGLAATQLLYAFSARSETHSIFDAGALPPNRFLKSSVLVSLGAIGAAQFIPGLRGLLGGAPVGALDCLICAAASGMALLLNEAMKVATREEKKMLPAPV